MLQNSLNSAITHKIGRVIIEHYGINAQVVIMNETTWKLLIEEVDIYRTEKERLSVSIAPRTYKDIEVLFSADLKDNEFRVY